MPEFTGIDHLAITVSDLEVSLPFYERLWGMTHADELGGDTFHRAIFRLPGGTTVGLTQHDAPINEPFSPLRPGMDHVGFGVATRDELQRWVIHLDAAGIEHSGLVDVSYGSALSVKDPDGTALEFFVRPQPTA